MKKFLKIFLWLIIASVFIGTFYFLYQNSKPKTTRYETVTPAKGNIERTTVLTGKIEPRDEIDIKPQISGIISEILVEAGQMVKTGDPIGKVGATGFVTGPHLHFTMSVNNVYTNPEQYLAADPLGE